MFTVSIITVDVHVLLHVQCMYITTLLVRIVTFEKLMAKISDFFSSFTNEWATF